MHAKTWLAALTLSALAGGVAQAATLEKVKKRGQVICGATTGFAGFSAPDAKGKWSGLDVDICRAVAAAIFGDATKFKIVPLNAQQRFTAGQDQHRHILVYLPQVLHGLFAIHDRHIAVHDYSVKEKAFFSCFLDNHFLAHTFKHQQCIYIQKNRRN